MELTMVNGFGELNERELVSIGGGELFLAILSGIGTVCAAVGTAYFAPPGKKIKATSEVIIAGVLLTAEAYELQF